ncbi:MAG: metallophosphoesterase [Saccharolobus sp.]|uniref:Cacineurin superfamily phosphoesterase n=1 Tax=Saccharolobus shibatae (strain ATCC 51178 / DSM 5389 / JCM 8931 / NBRC 15437 / B12) TaxID=523848 RepID=A0A8F5GT12_SACSH|nr:metallophosphoesterase [Saccharolobus shibatae]MCH4815666.1 metallophosphoesterase [Saccharolobus shibatae]QXJ27902.1 putative cacineurin superfamily phosphoesterase [Saccharolobus shibatae B12]
MGKEIKLLFVTDIHGSDVVFKKAINAANMFKVNYLVFGGDLVGKGVFPLYKRGDKYYDVNNNLLTKDKLEEIKKNGFYVYISEKENEIEDFNEMTINKLYAEFVTQQLVSWFKLIEERLKDVKVIWNLGNDDPPFVDDVFKNNDIKFEEIVEIDSSSSPLYMLNCPYTNETPYKSYRIVPEYTIYNKGYELLRKVNETTNAIFNFHAPPYNTKLDLAYVNGQWVHVGSRSVRELEEKFQPLLGLHGHIHESHAIDKIGKTTVINPGSEYTERILKYALITIIKEVKGLAARYKLASNVISKG